jgi:hypothetical protein
MIPLRPEQIDRSTTGDLEWLAWWLGLDCLGEKCRDALKEYYAEHWWLEDDEGDA